MQHFIQSQTDRTTLVQELLIITNPVIIQMADTHNPVECVDGKGLLSILDLLDSEQTPLYTLHRQVVITVDLLILQNTNDRCEVSSMVNKR